MKKIYLDFLCCPNCSSELSLHEEKLHGEKVETGTLVCNRCNSNYPIKNFVPRFVNYKTYADSFGPQWKTFAKSQLDDEEYHESTIRFDSEVGWNERDLKGKKIVELGSGAGRFIDVVSKRNPDVAIGVDVTDAVDASQENIGNRENVLFIQADIFKLPLKKEFVDFAYSIGVLHHTPNPQAAFNNMVDLVKDEGNVAVSLYEISYYHRPNRNTLKVVTIELLWALNTWRCAFFRLFTTKVPDRVMLLYCKTVIPILHYLNKIPVIGLIRYFFPSTCYKHLPVICSMVDTMDTYSTKIVHQYRAKDVFQWFIQLGLRNIIVMNSRAGWVSLNAEKGSEEDRNKRKRNLKQPASPGKKGHIE